MRTAAVRTAIAFAVAAGLGDADGEGGKLFFGLAGAAFGAVMFLFTAGRFQKFGNGSAFGAFVFE